MKSAPRGPRVAVVIPVYADRGTLALCLEALDSQTWGTASFETIVVDNGRNPKLADTVAQRPNVRVIREQRPGSYAARNAGIRASATPLLAFTDADCVPAPEWLERGLARLKQTRAGLVGGRIELFAADPERPTAAELYEFSQAFKQEVYVTEQRFAATANMFTRRSVFDEVGLFNPDLRSGGDKEWGFRVHAAGYDLAYAPDVVVRHPARRTFRALARKNRRTKAGRIDRHRRGALAIEPHNRPLTDRRGRPRKRNRVVGILVEISPPWERFAFFRQAMPDSTGPQRARVFFLLWGLGLARFAEAVRLRLGGKPPR